MGNSFLISPGISWYEASLGERPSFPCLKEDLRCDIAIIGGGFTGLSAAYHLAKAGLAVVLVDAGLLANGASGRNGGQMGTGQRQWVETLEKAYGFERTKELFDLSEQAKNHLRDLAQEENFSMDYQEGQLSVVHRKKLLPCYEKHIEQMARYGYHQLHFMDSQETAERLGSSRYFGGLRDTGTGHIHPLKAALGLAKAAQKKSAQLFENTKVTKIEKNAGGFFLTMPQAKLQAKHVLLATNAYNFGLEQKSARYIVPIRSYIGATSALEKDSSVLPYGESVDDSRFVVRYFRKTKEGVLLFGGAENYSSAVMRDIPSSVRKQLVEVYPHLKDIKLTHVWGACVAITVERMPFIRQIEPGLTYCGGYSGHGVMIAPYIGKLYAEALLGKSHTLELFKQLKISSFPGGAMLRQPAVFMALQWFSFLDRF